MKRSFNLDRTGRLPATIAALGATIGLFVQPAYSAPSGPLPTSDPVIRKAPAWQPPHVADIKGQVLAWLEKSSANPPTKAKAAAVIAVIGEQAAGTEILDRLAEAFAIVDPRELSSSRPVRIPAPAPCCRSSPG